MTFPKINKYFHPKEFLLVLIYEPTMPKISWQGIQL
jgi:hypothetical protein